MVKIIKITNPSKIHLIKKILADKSQINECIMNGGNLKNLLKKLHIKFAKIN